MHTNNQISLTRKTLYGIMLLGIFISAFGAGNLPPARAQEGTPDITFMTYVSELLGFHITYPNGWFVYPEGIPGDYSNLDQVLISTVALSPNDDGEYPVVASNGSTIVIGLKSTNYSASDQSLTDFVEKYLISPFFEPPAKEIQVAELRFIELDSELGRLLFIANRPNVFSVFLPASNLPKEQSAIDTVIGSIQFINDQKVDTPLGESPNSVPVVLYSSQSNGLSPQAVPSMKMPWDRSLQFKYNGGPHGNGDPRYWNCNPYVLSSLAGIDFSLKSTDEVLAVAGGTIANYYEGTSSNNGIGQYVQVDHGSGWKTQYWHLASIDPWVKANLQVQNAVQQGQVLGKAGKTGGQTAEHLHLQLKDVNGPYGWNRVSIDGYVVRSLIDATNTSRGLNYQGTLTKGSETLGPPMDYNCGAKTRDARMWTGSSGYIEAGKGTPVYSSNIRIKRGGGIPITALTAHGYHTCALTAEGGVKCWGDNSSGQLGDGTTTNRLKPVWVYGLRSGVIAIAAGFYHTCALTVASGVKCWGRNSDGQLGDGTTTDHLKPVWVYGLRSGVTAINADFYHTCALTADGGVKCWGANWFGQLGDGTKTNSLTPVWVYGLRSGVTTIAAGEYHTCALTTGDGVKCWGLNLFGQLGDGTKTNRLTPVWVYGLRSGVSAISAGMFHTCALTVTGGVKCWGRNSDGQLGDGTKTDHLKPLWVYGLRSGVTAINASRTHTCALTSGGGVKCWGWNGSGQLGDGTDTDRLKPVWVYGLRSSVTAITAGEQHTCALNTDRRVMCWGANFSGQLGDGTTTRRLKPVWVIGL